MSGENCIICKILRGEAPGLFLHRTEDAAALLDIFPHAPGHTLVVPVSHVETLADLPEAQISSVFNLVQAAARKLQERLGAEGLTIGINQGQSAGQALEHLHIHIMPRFPGDGGGSVHSIVNQPGSKKPSEMVEQLKF